MYASLRSFLIAYYFKLTKTDYRNILFPCYIYFLKKYVSVLLDTLNRRVEELYNLVAMAAPENWMQPPQQANATCPGLEYLTMVDQLLVHQKVELLEGKIT